MKKVFLVEPNYLGDILMTTPAIRILHDYYKEKIEITVITNNLGKQILELNPYIDNIIVRKSKSLSNRIALLKEIVLLKPDYIVLFRTTFYNALLSFLSGAEISAGVNVELARLLLDKTIEYDKNRNYRLECLRILELVYDFKTKLPDELDKIDVYTSPDDEKYVDMLLKDTGLSAADKIVIINPGTTRIAKQWLPDRYASIMDELSGRGYKPVITGSDNDIAIINEIVKVTKCNVVNLTNKTTIRQLISLIKRAQLFISPDTGPMYIAIANNVNAITLFGSTNPEKYGPFNNQKHHIIYKKLNCSPCYKNYCPLLPQNMPAPCMENITVDEVLDKIAYLV